MTDPASVLIVAPRQRALGLGRALEPIYATRLATSADAVRAGLLAPPAVAVLDPDARFAPGLDAITDAAGRGLVGVVRLGGNNTPVEGHAGGVGPSIVDAPADPSPADLRAHVDRACYVGHVDRGFVLARRVAAGQDDDVSTERDAALGRADHALDRLIDAVGGPQATTLSDVIDSG